MNPQLIRIANRIAQEHPNLIRALFWGSRITCPLEMEMESEKEGSENATGDAESSQMDHTGTP